MFIFKFVAFVSALIHGNVSPDEVVLVKIHLINFVLYFGYNNLALVGAFGKRAGGKLGKIFWPRQILCQMPKSTSIFGFCKVFGASDPPNEKFANKKILQGKANTHLLLWFFRWWPIPDFFLIYFCPFKTISGRLKND